MTNFARLEQLANDGVMNARTVLNIRRSQAAGLTSQMTTDEIAAMLQADAADPQVALNRRRARVGLPPIA
jgi:hypothetical protein